jgi:hypothetical protein
MVVQLHLVVIGDEIDDLVWRVDHLPVPVIILLSETRSPGQRRHRLPLVLSLGGAYAGNSGRGGREAMCSVTMPIRSMA